MLEARVDASGAWSYKKNKQKAHMLITFLRLVNELDFPVKPAINLHAGGMTTQLIKSVQSEALLTHDTGKCLVPLQNPLYHCDANPLTAVL